MVLSPLATINVLLTNPAKSIAVAVTTVGCFSLIGKYENAIDVG